MNGTILRYEKHTYTMQGDQLVSSAGRLMDKLPNGYVLESLSYDDVDATWIAIVTLPVQEVQ